LETMTTTERKGHRAARQPRARARTRAGWVTGLLTAGR
jgi:hypothetical protein